MYYIFYSSNTPSINNNLFLLTIIKCYYIMNLIGLPAPLIYDDVSQWETFFYKGEDV